ncbi:MAG: formate dehydrogenase accessory sulfurtransferase FdhD [Nitriliruptoraceae bacterium]|nr:formate dehydrogenase accessory sulfurtransferase FdhD [Nitriliruptoraceae bacterium]
MSSTPAPTRAGIVFVGGSSRRMGRDKAEVVFDGTPLLTRTLTALRAGLGPTAELLVSGPTRLPPGAGGGEGGRAGADRAGGAGPLAGLGDALGDLAPDTIAVTVGVDHPLLVEGVLRLLADELAAAPPEVTTLALAPGALEGRRPQLLVAAHRAGPTARIVDELVGRGERRLHALLDHAQVATVPARRWRALDPLGRTLFDVDDEVERRELEGWWQRARATAPDPARTSAREVPSVAIVRIRSGQATDERDHVIAEEPLEIRAAGPGQQPVTLVTTMRTPGHEPELAVGWLLAEGIIEAGDLRAIHPGDAALLARPDDLVTVEVARAVDPDAVAHRHAVATASCGVCGRASIEELTGRLTPLAHDGAPLAWSVLAPLPDELRLAQRRFDATGGVHAAGLADRRGRLVTVREDVGRHNALDAVVGAHALGGVWPEQGLRDLVLVLSGRIGFELVAKAAAARVPIVVAVGAASDLAVRTAERLGVTLVGFVRAGDGVVYTHPGRIRMQPPG